MVKNVTKSFLRSSSAWDIVLLGIALAIDLVGILPLPFDVPDAALEALFLMYLGVPPARSILGGATELVPILDLIPWCTLTVLYRRFGVDFGGLSRFFGK